MWNIENGFFSKVAHCNTYLLSENFFLVLFFPSVFSRNSLRVTHTPEFEKSFFFSSQEKFTRDSHQLLLGLISKNKNIEAQLSKISIFLRCDNISP